MKWQENATPVTKQSIAAAISWVETLAVELTASEVGCLDALLEAGKDKTVSTCPWLAPGHGGGFQLNSSHSVTLHSPSTDLRPLPAGSDRDPIRH